MRQQSIIAEVLEYLIQIWAPGLSILADVTMGMSISPPEYQLPENGWPQNLL